MPEPFKNLISPARLERLGGRIHSVHPNFDQKAFLAHAVKDLAGMELKQRVRHVAATLKMHLPPDYPQALAILSRMLEETCAPAGEGFGLWPACHFIEEYGLEHFDASMAAMPLFTQHFSCEFAIRPYLLHDASRALRHVHSWLSHDSERVRRLVTEGTRPRLPWGQRLPMFQENPDRVILLLDHLYRDESEFVRRSVANNINDISKDHPELAVATLRRWQDRPGPHFERLRHHALRTLLKQGRPEALALQGFGDLKALTASLSLACNHVQIGGSLPFELVLQNGHDRGQCLMIDYVLHLKKKSGALKPKVFKWTRRTLAPGERAIISRAHALKAVTVRQYYAGEQILEIVVNGQSMARAHFTLAL